MHRPKLMKSRQMHSRIFTLLAIFTLFTTSPALSVDSVIRQAMLWTGYALVIAGTFGRIYCSAFIGGRKNKTIVRTGPFSVVRNPLYIFSFLGMVGIGLQSGTIIVTLTLALVFVIYYPMVVEKEEAFLKHKFGPSYDDYTREVPRWIPNFKLWNEPVEITSRPHNIRDTIYDAAAFFLPFPIFTLVAILQYHDILPVWLIVP